MNNYEYIIASLPVPDESSGKLDAGAVLSEIKELCSESDNRLIDLLLDAFEPDKLDCEFYDRALASRNGFIREYLRYDLRVRNTKVEYINRTLGRPEDLDIMPESGDAAFDGKAEVEAVLEQGDILGRECGLDKLMWNKADELVLMHVFDLDVILAFVAKIKITDRWNKLDPATGRELFRKLVEEIRKTRQYGN